MTALRAANVLSEIAHALAGCDRTADRIKRAMTLAQTLIPYRRCAVLAATSPDSVLHVVPAAEPVDERELAQKLAAVGELIRTDVDHLGYAADPSPHLTLPLVGMDRVVGVIRVDAGDDYTYAAEHVTLLSLVGAQLGAYLVTIQLQQDMQQQLHQLEVAREIQRVVFGVVGHDLRGPLNVVLAAATLLRDDIQPGMRRKLTGRIESNVGHMTRILDDLRDVTLVHATGGIALDVRSMPVGALVADVVSDLRLAYPDARIDVAGASDETDATITEWDPDRIAQLLTNLVRNAVQHGRAGASIQVAVDVAGEHVVLAVTNTGSPIAKELLPQLFDPFTRGQDPCAVRARGGLGLGLYVVAQITRSHGGRVDVDSTVEATTFAVTLPKSAAALTRRSSDVAPASRRRA